MQKWIVLCVVVFIGYVGYSYYATECYAGNPDDESFNFVIEREHVRETGYVFDIWVTRHLFRKKEITWAIKIPSTNKTYMCEWQAGFSGYEKNEGVVLIHMPGGTGGVNWDGYIIGLHGKHKGKKTSVWALDNWDLLLGQ